MNTVNRRFSVAPMMDWTTHECRYFLRLISKRALLYTEMVTTGALIHGDSARFLRHDQSEHPVALQLGGSNTCRFQPLVLRWPLRQVLMR